MSILRNKMHALHEAQQCFTVMKRNVKEEQNFESYSPEVLKLRNKMFLFFCMSGKYIIQIHPQDPFTSHLNMVLDSN